MKYQKFGDTFVIRMEIGDDIPEKMLEFVKAQDIKLASVSGIGATDDFTVGVFNTDRYAYDQSRFTGNHEITSLIGNITTMNGEYYVHLHMECAGPHGVTVGGHLLKARVSLTAEIFVTCLDGEISRVRDEEHKINILGI